MYFAKSRSCCCLICLINFGWSEGRGWNCSSIRCVLLKNIRKIRRMRKQSIPGLPSFRGWPGVEAKPHYVMMNQPCPPEVTSIGIFCVVNSVLVYEIYTPTKQSDWKTTMLHSCSTNQITLFVINIV